MLRRAALLTPLLALLLLPGAATADSGTTLSTLSGAGRVWTGTTVSAGGGPLRYELQLGSVRAPATLSAHLYDGERSLHAVYLTLRHSNSRGGLVVDGPGAAGSEVKVDLREEHSRDGLRNVVFTATFDVPVTADPVEYTVFGFVASPDVGHWTTAVRGPAGAALLGTSRGNRTWIYDENDFTSEVLSARAEAFAAGVSVDARANVRARRALQLEEQFLGTFHDFNPDEVIHFTDPTGRRGNCPLDCLFDPAKGVQPVGRWVFGLDGTGRSVVVTDPASGEQLFGQTGSGLTLAGAHVQAPAASSLPF